MGVRDRIADLVQPPAPLPEPPAGLRIDLGCGGLKREGFVGLDQKQAPGVDHVLDFIAEPLPFEDDSVAHVFSSHCIEHLDDPRPLFKEISRVCKHDAMLELWVPHASNDTAVLLGHVTQWTGEFFVHVSSAHVEHWYGILGARWRIDSIVHVVRGEVEARVREQGIPLGFAIEHLRNVVLEMGVFGRVDKKNEYEAPMPRFLMASSRSSRWIDLEGGWRGRLAEIVRG